MNLLARKLTREDLVPYTSIYLVGMLYCWRQRDKFIGIVEEIVFDETVVPTLTVTFSKFARIPWDTTEKYPRLKSSVIYVTHNYTLSFPGNKMRTDKLAFSLDQPHERLIISRNEIDKGAIHHLLD